MPSSQPENQLDNDKDLRQEILYEFLNQFKEDKYLSQGNTDKAVGAIDQYTQSKLKAFAGEVERQSITVLPETYPTGSRTSIDAVPVESLKAIKEKAGIE